MGTKTYYKRKIDAWVSKKVREKGYCEWCGTRSGQMQCAHVVGRANHTLRFDLKNVLCLCATCHRKAHNDPIGYTMWFQSKFPDRFTYLNELKNTITKRTLNDYKELAGRCI